MRLFGTDGVRGVANKDLTAELAYNLGKAGAHVLSHEKEQPLIIIGRDTRISGDMLEDALSAGILSMGGNVIKAGVLPTPAVAWLVKHVNADAGVVISASHNPYEYNGIKFFNKHGFKLDDGLEDEIEDVINGAVDVSSHIHSERLGRRCIDNKNYAEAYINFLISVLDQDIGGMYVVLDCANGASFEIAPKVFHELGVRVSVIGDKPDGLNINNGFGSTHPEKLLHTVLNLGADLGLAFDGDADRVIAVDEKGNIVNGDTILYILAKQLTRKQSQWNKMVTATVMSNIGLTKALGKIGCSIQITDVGDRYVIERMLETGSLIGGEQSGHVIMLDHTTTGDGILTGMLLAGAIRSFGQKLSELAAEVRVYPQILKNAAVANDKKHRFREDDVIMNEIARIEQLMAGEGRILIRPSGTEPLVRVMIEGSDPDMITEMATGLADLIVSRCG